MLREVVITGIGAVSPNGLNRTLFKQSLLNGISGIRKIQSFDASDFESRIAGEVELNGHFSKKEKRNLPRTAQLAILASEEAFQDANLISSQLSDSERENFGVILGTGGGSAEFIESHFQMLYGQKNFEPSLYAIPASTAGGLSSELSIRFGLLGLSHVITTGCTSSTDALGYAFEAIRSGRLDRVLAGGSDAPLSSGILKGFTLMKILSTRWNETPEQASRPFSKDRDGFVLGEGAWMFILEEKAHAKARGAKIYAEITGYGASCEAFHAVRLDEKRKNPFRAVPLALEQSKIEPENLGYVNLHGTSTILNDQVETAVMKGLLGNRAHVIPMSATKSMIGHPQGASGAAGLAATLLAREDGFVHPTINLEMPDPECDLDYVPGQARKTDFEFAMIHTLGFGSKCSALIIRHHA